MPKQRGRHSANLPSTKEVILHTAYKLFAMSGYENTSLRQIASNAGVDAALIVYQFSSKSGLWQAVIEYLRELERPYIEHAAGLKDSERPSSELVRDMLREFLKISRHVPEFPAFVNNERSSLERYGIIREKIVIPLMDAYRPIISRAVEEGIFPECDEEVIFSFFLRGISRTAADYDFPEDSTEEAQFTEFLYSMIKE